VRRAWFPAAPFLLPGKEKRDGEVGVWSPGPGGGRRGVTPGFYAKTEYSSYA
jgi:hypothetical protein